MLLFLVGLPGSGKTTVGKLLAEELLLPFFDTDDIISSIEQMTIPEIFKAHGEAYFRLQEKTIIENWKLVNAVVSTGGGLPCHDHLMEKLNGMGTTIWLSTSLKKISERFRDDESRPLVDRGTASQKYNYLKRLLDERKSFYEAAQIKIISVDDTPLMIQKIKRKLRDLRFLGTR